MSDAPRPGPPLEAHRWGEPILALAGAIVLVLILAAGALGAWELVHDIAGVLP